MTRCTYITGASELKEFVICPNRWHIHNIKSTPKSSMAEDTFYGAKHDLLLRLFGIEFAYLHVDKPRYGRKVLEKVLKQDWKKLRKDAIEEYGNDAPLIFDATSLEEINPDVKKFAFDIKVMETELRVLAFSKGDDLPQPLINRSSCICARPDYIVSARIEDSIKCFPFEVQSSALCAEEFPDAMRIQLAADRMCMAKAKKLNGFKNAELLDYGVSAYLKGKEVVEKKIPLKDSEEKVAKTVAEIRKIRAIRPKDVGRNEKACNVCPKMVKESCLKS